MKHGKIIAAMAVIYLVLGAFSFAPAEPLLSIMPTSDGTTAITETNRREEIIVNIMLDDPTGVAGCAFTLHFDPGVFTPPATDADGLPVVAGDIISVFPFSYEATQTHRENASESGKLYFSGAAIDPTDGGGIYGSAGDVALFTFKMKVNKDATLGNTTLYLKQTELWNLDAGYGTDNNSNGEYDEGTDEMGKVTVLVGALDNTDPDFDDLTKAFPVIIGDPAGDLATKTLSILDCEDNDNDQLCDRAETETGVWVSADDTGTSPDNPDSDGDGFLDGVETNTDTYVDGTDTGTDPNLADSDGDGFDDKEEADLNTDPNDATSYPLYVYFTGPDTVNVDGSANFVLTADVPPGETLKEYQITIQYDNTLVSYASHQTDSYPFPPDTVDTATAGQIVVSGTDATGVAGPDTISLVELTLDGDAAGTLDLIITVDSFSDNAGTQFTMIPEDHPLEVITCIPGDADMSGSVDIFDALMIAQYSAFILTEEEVPGFLCCDVDCSGGVDIFDALKVAQYAAFIIPDLSCD